MESIHFSKPTSSSLFGNKRKYGHNYNNTLVIHDSKAVKYATATMAQPGTQYKRKFKKTMTKRKRLWAPKITKKVIKDLMQPEVKSIDNYSTAFYPNTGSAANQITFMNPLAQGVTRGTRIGNKVQGVSLEVKISAIQTAYLGLGPNPINIPQTCEYLIIQQKAANKSVLLIGDIKELFPISEFPFSFHAITGDRKCKVLHRGVIDVDGGHSGENNYREIHIPLKCTTTYVSNTGSIADVQENSLWFVFLTSTNVTTGSGGSYTVVYPTYQAVWRYKYIDV